MLNVLYGCETRYRTLSCEHRQRMLGIRILREYLGRPREEVWGGGTKVRRQRVSNCASRQSAYFGFNVLLAVHLGNM